MFAAIASIKFQNALITHQRRPAPLMKQSKLSLRKRRKKPQDIHCHYSIAFSMKCRFIHFQ